MKISIEEATINDIDEIIKLKKDIWNNLENKEWYVIDGTNKNFLKKQLENDGLILKATNTDKIVGFLIVSNSLRKDSTIIQKLNLKNEVNICIELSNGAVDIKYRGNNLYTKMAKKAEKLIMNRYNKKYILATVHPDNIASLKSLLKIGYKIICKSKMYGNLDRYILLKRLKTTYNLSKRNIKLTYRK